MSGASRGDRPSFAWSWLDPAVALAALEEVRGPVLATEPGADLAMALVASRDDEVCWTSTAVADFAVADLKRVAATELPVEGARILLGLEPAGRRVFFYHLIRGALSEVGRAWWDEREDLIREGVCQCGSFERLMERFARPGRRGAILRGLGSKLPALAWKLAQVDPGWATALDPARRAVWDERVWPVISATGHAALAQASERYSIRSVSLQELSAPQAWAGVVLGAVFSWSPALLTALQALPSGARVLGWAATSRLEPPAGFIRRQDLEARLAPGDRSLPGGLCVFDRRA